MYMNGTDAPKVVELVLSLFFLTLQLLYVLQ